MGKCYRMQTEVYCTLQVEGTHCWPDCPFEEVSYLRTPHRHMFHIKAHKLVKHDDRDIEFIMLKHEINKFLLRNYYEADTGSATAEEFYPGSKVLSFGAMSCEMIAKELILRFDLSCCEVSEDGENGAIVHAEEVL